MTSRWRTRRPSTSSSFSIGWAEPWPGAHGYKIFQRVGNGWSWESSGAATRIAATPGGTPWVVNDLGKIYKWSGSQWNLQTGLGRDLAVGTDDVWVIGYNQKDPGDLGYGVYYLDATNWVLTNGRGKRIAVEPDGDSVWIVDFEGAVRRAEPNGTETLSWVHMNAGTNLPAADVAVTSNGTAWIVGGPVGADGYPVYTYDGSGWLAVGQGVEGVSIGVSPSGIVWVAGNSGKIYRSVGPAQCS